MKRSVDAAIEIERIQKTDDYYRILGVERNAEKLTIKKAYRKLALKLHPDKCVLDGAEEAFKKVSSAFSTLSDESKRAHYDRFGSAPNPSVGNSTARHPHFNTDADFLREIFRQQAGGGGGGGFRFHFPAGFQQGRSGPGRTFATSIDNILPAPIRLILKMIPFPLIIVFFVTFGSFFLGFLLSRLQYIFLIMYFVPSGMKLPAFGIFLVLGLLGHI